MCGSGELGSSAGKYELILMGRQSPDSCTMTCVWFPGDPFSGVCTCSLRLADHGALA